MLSYLKQEITHNALNNFIEGAYVSAVLHQQVNIPLYNHAPNLYQSNCKLQVYYMSAKTKLNLI